MIWFEQNRGLVIHVFQIDVSVTRSSLHTTDVPDFSKWNHAIINSFVQILCFCPLFSLTLLFLALIQFEKKWMNGQLSVVWWSSSSAESDCWNTNKRRWREELIVTSSESVTVNFLESLYPFHSFPPSEFWYSRPKCYFSFAWRLYFLLTFQRPRSTSTFSVALYSN